MQVPTLIEHAALASTASAAVFAGLAALAAVSQARISQNDQRPWVTSPAVDISRSSDANGYLPQLTFRNVGRTPTRGLYVGARFIGPEDVKKAAAGICADGVKARADASGNFYLYSIVPQSEFTIGNLDKVLDINFVPKTLQERHASGIVGCVVYGSPFDAVDHKTMFWIPFILGEAKPRVDHVWALEPD